MSNWVKKIFWFLVVAFALYYLVTRPEDAANIVRSIVDAFRSLGTFFSQLAS